MAQLREAFATLSDVLVEEIDALRNDAAQRWELAEAHLNRHAQSLRALRAEIALVRDEMQTAQHGAQARAQEAAEREGALGAQLAQLSHEVAASNSAQHLLQLELVEHKAAAERMAQQLDERFTRVQHALDGVDQRALEQCALRAARNHVPRAHPRPRPSEHARVHHRARALSPPSSSPGGIPGLSGRSGRVADSPGAARSLLRVRCVPRERRRAETETALAALDQDINGAKDMVGHARHDGASAADAHKEKLLQCAQAIEKQWVHGKELSQVRGPAPPRLPPPRARAAPLRACARGGGRARAWRCGRGAPRAARGRSGMPAAARGRDAPRSARLSRGTPLARGARRSASRRWWARSRCYSSSCRSASSPARSSRRAGRLP